MQFYVATVLRISQACGMIAAAIGILARDFYFELKYRQSVAAGTTPAVPRPELHWRASVALAMLAWGPILLALSIVVVPSGMGGVRVSQTSGTASKKNAASPIPDAAATPQSTRTSPSGKSAGRSATTGKAPARPADDE